MRTVVPTKDRRWVRSNFPNTPLTNFLQGTHAMDRRSHDDPSFTTGMVVRDPVPKSLSLFLSVLLRTPVTDRHSMTHATVLVVKDLVPKGLSVLLVSSDGHMRWTVIHTTVRPV